MSAFDSTQFLQLPQGATPVFLHVNAAAKSRAELSTPKPFSPSNIYACELTPLCTDSIKFFIKSSWNVSYPYIIYFLSTQNEIKYLFRNFIFCHLFKLNFIIFCYKRHDICITAKACTVLFKIICDNHITIFLFKFLS